MVFRRFSFFLAVRVVLVGLAIAATMWLLLEPGYHGATFVAGSILLLFSAELWRFVSRTNREIARFLDAARYADFRSASALMRSAPVLVNSGPPLPTFLSGCVVSAQVGKWKCADSTR